MSIYIKGMEMPTRCYACPCADLEYYDCNLMPGTRIEQHKRLDSCPLVQVPEHGRLIDADALMAEDRQIYRSDGAAIGRRRYIELYEIDDAPTIIPADPAEGGEG